MSIELKIKAKHLALEPSIIRIEEYKLRKKAIYIKETDYSTPVSYFDRWVTEDGTAKFGCEHSYWRTRSKESSLANHRRTVVRDESRATGLARAFLAGKLYKQVEMKRLVDQEDKEAHFWNKIVPRVDAMVSKYSTVYETKKNAKELVKAWIES